MLSIRPPKPIRGVRRTYRSAHLLPCAHRILQHQTPKRPKPPTSKAPIQIPQGSPRSPYIPPQPRPGTIRDPHIIRLPHALATPIVPEVNRAGIEKNYPELKRVPTEYIRKGLAVKGSVMMNAVANVKADPPKHHLPKEMNIKLNDKVAAACPSHMLAVYSHTHTLRSEPPQPRRVTLYPVHSLVFSSHCSNLPPLSPHCAPTPATPGSVNIPVVPLGLPSAETFPILQSYMYTKRADSLLASLLPISPAFIKPGTPLESIMDEHAEILGNEYDIPTLLRHAMIINGLWRNACALGVYDDNLWATIDVAWGSVIRGIEIAKIRSPEY